VQQQQCGKKSVSNMLKPGKGGGGTNAGLLGKRARSAHVLQQPRGGKQSVSMTGVGGWAWIFGGVGSNPTNRSATAAASG
jgi:hypothetical protein